MTILTHLPTDAFVTAALAELLEDVTNLLDSAKAQKPQDKEEIGFWKRQLNALNKAEFDYVSGVRPVISGDAYLVPSASRPGALIHRLTKQGGIAMCSCEAGQRGLLCRHHMLINVVERAAEMESTSQKEAAIASSGPEQTPESSAALLAERIEATAQTLQAMRAAQGRSPLSFDPPGDDNPLGSEEGDEVPARRLGMRLASARKKSAYFASAFYLAA